LNGWQTQLVRSSAAAGNLETLSSVQTCLPVVARKTSIHIQRADYILPRPTCQLMQLCSMHRFGRCSLLIDIFSMHTYCIIHNAWLIWKWCFEATLLGSYILGSLLVMYRQVYQDQLCINRWLHISVTWVWDLCTIWSWVLKKSRKLQ